MENVRSLAAQILLKQQMAGQYSNIALDTAIKRHPMNDADRGLLTSLVYGVTERMLTLDYRIDRLADKPDELTPEVRTVLRLGIYQLAFLDRIPDHAAVNETVKAAPERAKGLVNAVLRRFLREGCQLGYPDGEKVVEWLSVRYSVGVPLTEKFLSVFGPERTESLFSAFEKHPPLTLRTNTLRTTREELCKKTAGTPTAFSPYGVTIPSGSVTALEGFGEGLFFVQDEASQLCVEALDVHPGMRVLDTCACPGSKSFGIAMNLQNDGTVVACDLHENKLSLITKSAERLGIDNITVCVQDGKQERADFCGSFDRVLCDVPCSGFGVLAKKPELRYKDPADSAGLPEVQYGIVETASKYLKAGGKLVYSTCTVLPEENEDNVGRFLREHPDFSLQQSQNLYPDTDSTDGFYFAVLVRN